MTNDPVLIAYMVKDAAPGKKAVWRRIGVALPHDRGSGLTVLLDALPKDGRIVLVEPRSDFDAVRPKPPKRK
jgi:hypothetical protein